MHTLSLYKVHIVPTSYPCSPSTQVLHRYVGHLHIAWHAGIAHFADG